jgi:tetratricopeptide (TPR) repeat protein
LIKIGVYCNKKKVSFPKPILFFLLWLLCLCSSTIAQEKKKSKSVPNSKFYKQAPSSVSKDPSFLKQDDGWTLLQEAEALKSRNPSLAIEKVEEALRLSIKEGNKSQEAKCYQVLGAINLNSRLNTLAIQNSQKALEMYVALKNEREANKTRFQLAEAFYANNQLNEALIYYQQHNQIAEKQKNEDEAIKSKFKIAEIENKKGSSGQALEKYEEILETEKSKGNTEGVSEANKRIGEIYQSKNQNKQALKYYKQAQDAAEKDQDAVKYSEINDNISSVLKADKNYEAELDIRQKSLEKSKESKEPAVENKENIAIANTYLDMNQSQNAIPYLKRSIVLSDKIGSLQEKGEALKSLSEAYKQQKKFDLALQNYQKYMGVKDAILAQKEREIEEVLNTNMALTMKQKKIDFLEKDMELNRQTISALTHEKVAQEERMSRQWVIIYSLVIGILLIIAVSYLLYKNMQKRRIANQLLALKSLRSQMNPHFIFNALNSVNAFISKHDEKSANKYLSDFSKLMRMVMENSQQDFVPLSQEIHILELYLSLEHFRFKEKFDYTFTVDEAIDPDAYEVPPMLIQPYIENAVWHGLRYKEEKGTLRVSFIKKEGNGIAIEIEDNGIGRKKSAELKTLNQKSNDSTGIKNTVSRIAIINELYHKNIQLDIQDRFQDQKDTGTKVVIGLPKKR